jgi:hypothetical protein
MNQRRRLESVATLLSPDEVPTSCFFAVDSFQAASGYGAQTPIEVLESIEAVNATIHAVDELRTAQHLDLIDTAILIQREVNPHHAQTASSVAGSIVQAVWNWDKERYGEDKAWRQQRSRGEFESLVAGRLVGMVAS